MSTMTVWNKGKRLWLKSQVRGLTADIGPNESSDLDEAVARRLVMDYPHDFSLAGKSMPSNDELARREQSIRDRENNLDKWEAELEVREKTVTAKEAELGIAPPAPDAPAEPTKSDLVAEAQTLGINADSRWSVKKLAEVIAEKKAAK